MDVSDKNRVTSSKTPRGSRHPHRYAGHDGIVQPVPDEVQHPVTIEEVNRVLNLGQLLCSVLTPEELVEIAAESDRAGKQTGQNGDRMHLSFSAHISEYSSVE